MTAGRLAMTKNLNGFLNLIIPGTEKQVLAAVPDIETTSTVEIVAAVEPEGVTPDTFQKEAAVTGRYGFSKDVERDASTSIKKLQRHALTLAKAAYAKDPKVEDFLKTHAKRGKSMAAAVLLSAMKEIGPKLGSMEKTAGGVKGLYGFPQKTAHLGLTTCAQIKEHAGIISSDLHHRRMGKYDKITGFLRECAKNEKCAASKILLAGYPELDLKLASESVDYWVSMAEEDLG